MDALAMDSKKRRMDTSEGPSAEQVQTWLSGMTRDSAVEFISGLAIRFPEVMEAVQEKIRDDPSFCKLFIRSLDWTTTDDGLRDFFSQYGDIQEAVVLKDNATGKSKGFGFVTFMQSDAAQRALESKVKQLDGRDISCHLAAEKNHRPVQSRNYGSTAPGFSSYLQTPGAQGANADKRLFVRGLAWETSTGRLRETFQQFGPIIEAAVVADKGTGKSKGFGFVTFQSPESARAALAQPDKYIDGRLTTCNYASERGGGAGGGGGVAPQAAAPQLQFQNPMALQLGGGLGVGGGMGIGGGLGGLGGGGAGLQQQLKDLQQQQFQITQKIFSTQQEQLSQQMRQVGK